MSAIVRLLPERRRRSAPLQTRHHPGSIEAGALLEYRQLGLIHRQTESCV
jgi:hypothetical protein